MMIIAYRCGGVIPAVNEDSDYGNPMTFEQKVDERIKIYFSQTGEAGAAR